MKLRRYVTLKRTRTGSPGLDPNVVQKAVETRNLNFHKDARYSVHVNRRFPSVKATNNTRTIVVLVVQIVCEEYSYVRVGGSGMDVNHPITLSSGSRNDKFLPFKLRCFMPKPFFASGESSPFAHTSVW